MKGLASINERPRRVFLLAAGFIVVLCLLPFFDSDSYFLQIAILSLVFASLATSWNFVSGYVGVHSFGHQAFFGVGGYTSALLSINAGLNPWLGLLAGAVAAALANCVIASPVFRLRGAAYVAVITLIFAQVIALVIQNLPQRTGGVTGLAGIPSFPSVFGVEFSLRDQASLFYVAVILLALTFAVCAFMLTGRRGLAFGAIRDSVEAAESLGVRTWRYRLFGTTVGAALAGLAGGFYAHYLMLLTPDSTLGAGIMVEILAMTILGGIGTFFGPAIGAFIITFGLESLRDIGNYQLMVYGAVLIVVMLVLPRGLATMDGLLPFLTRRRRPGELSGGSSDGGPPSEPSETKKVTELWSRNGEEVGDHAR